MRFGKEIRRRRKALGLTQDALAERAKISPHFVSGLENGYTRDPSLSTVQALAKGLGVTVGELLGASKSAPDLSPLATEVGRLFDAAHEELQRAVLTILRGAARRRTR
jgi:transcriptional regulator with XRE-family HTH domain